MDDPDEEKEAVAAEGQALLEALQHLTTGNIQPLESTEFNINDIVKFFRTNSAGTDLLSEGNSKQQFTTLVRATLREALRGDDPLVIEGILQTLGAAGQQIEANQDTDPTVFLENVIQQTFPLERLETLRGKVFQPIDVGKLIEVLFTDDLQRLEQRNISQEEIASIRQQFQTDLDSLEKSIATATETEISARIAEADVPVGREEENIFLFGQNTLLMLQKYLQDHVHNNQLKRLLISDVQNLISQNTQKLGIQLGQAPQTIIPISATQNRVLRDPLKNALIAVIRPELDEIIRITESFGATDPGEEVKQMLSKMTLEIIRKFNKFVEKNKIRDPTTGNLITIATETKTQGIQGLLVPAPPIGFAIRGAQTDIVGPVDTATLITELGELLQSLSSPLQSFEFVPMTIRDPGTGQTKEQIVEDLINMERELKQAKSRVRFRTKILDSSISRRAGLRNITMAMGRRRVQIATSQSGFQIKTHGANMREIRINKDVTLAELAKVANMIAMENGSLETIDEIPLLNVIKGVTTIQEIVNVLMEVQKSHAGNDYSVLFVPANVFGGMFLDGPLDVIHKNRMLVNPVGGNIFSSIFNTVGNVVKTVASVPLAIAGSVFGGGFMPTAVRNDAPQFGGAPHISSNFLRGGELQPEPFANTFHTLDQTDISVGNTFHIQPFPYDGRIDNTGFIDQSQINPKFVWSELPVNSLTHFP